MPTYKTREQWLQAAVRKLTPWFKELGLKVPPVYVSVSYPHTGAKGKAIGLCAYHGDDGNPQLMIHPKLDDPVLILATLLHEVVHAVLPPGAQHGAEFKKVAVALGLEGKMTATVASEELTESLTAMAERLGPYPHSKLESGYGIIKKQTTRMIKVICREDPEDGYTARTTRKWLDEYGAPICPCHQEEMIEA